MKMARKEGHSRFSIEGPATVGKNGPATFRSQFDLRKYQIYLRIYQISSEKISNYHLSKLGDCHLACFHFVQLPLGHIHGHLTLKGEGGRRLAYRT